MPTFYSAAEAEEYVAQAKRRAKNEIDRYNESHKEPEKQEPAAQPEGVQSGSDAKWLLNAEGREQLDKPDWLALPFSSRRLLEKSVWLKHSLSCTLFFNYIKPNL